MIKNKCKDVIGTGNCSYAIYLPWKVKFDWEDELVCVAIDKCLLPEILQLWEMGIKTTGCCCGHGNFKMAYIGVQDSYIEKMKELGYEVHFNSYRPNDEDSFTPKTKLEYGINKNNGEWEVKMNSTEQLLCGNCDNPIEEHFNYCPNCGEKINMEVENDYKR